MKTNLDDDSSSPVRRPSREPMFAKAAIAGIAVIIVAIIAFVLLRPQPPPPAPVAAPPKPAMLTTPEQADQAEQHAAQVLSQAGVGTDGWLRAQLANLSQNPLWLGWITATRDLTDSAAVVIANFADDDDPRKRLQPMRPSEDFTAAEQGGVSVESPASAARFDAAVGVIESLDAKTLATLYRSIHPLIAVAYRGVGRPGVSLDRATGAALKRIEGAPVPAAAPAIERIGKLWLYTDPEVEKLGPIEKMLIRMGPTNERKLQAKAHELQQALGVP